MRDVISESKPGNGQEVPWHALGPEEAVSRLQTPDGGLDAKTVAARQREYGRNVMPAAQGPGFFRIILRQFMSPLIYVLIVAGILSASVGDLKDALFIFAVVLTNAAFGTFQEMKAEKGASELQSLVKTYAAVMRDGRRSEVDSEELVPGDIVLLESGARVPADIRLTEVTGLLVDESVLTGESAESAKATGALGEDLPVADRVNMAFAGTMVRSGRAAGVVTATGERSEFGKIAGALAGAKAQKPPLVIRMESFSRTVSIVVVVAGVLLGALSVVRGISIGEAFFFATALAVSAIPEGLPVGITIALSIGTRRMAKRNVIVRQLTAVEGLGSCTCIASDKTGTLTVNMQTVKVVSLPGAVRLGVSGQGYSGEGEVTAPGGEALSPAQSGSLEALGTAAIIGSDASLEAEDGEWRSHGDAVDLAFVALAHKSGLSPDVVRREHQTAGDIPFESERRYSARLYRDAGGFSVAAKGAFDALLPLCGSMLLESGEAELDPPAIEREATALAEEGYRVIAVAGGRYDGSGPSAFGEETVPPLTFLGLAGLIDPIRPEAKGAVDECRAAGIKVVMVTGDHPSTALAIARELDIAEAPGQVVTGAELSALGSPRDAEFLDAVERATVFARVAPLQKVEIVEALVELGHFVAVTGDGVNDAPALRRANIGVAMGSGTDVAKDTASIIVTDDNFASIVAGVEEGRFAYGNIRKITWLLISQGFAEVLLFAAVLIAGLPLALVAVQILWLNLVTNGLQHIALTFEPGERDAMLKPPRRPTERVFDRLMTVEVVVAGCVIGLVAFGAWYYLLEVSGIGETAARNLILLLMVLSENVHVFNCRSETASAFRVPLRRNLLLVGAVIAAQGLQLLAMQVGFLQNLLEAAPVSLTEWLYLLALASAVLWAVEIKKLVSRRAASRTGPGAPAGDAAA